MIQGLGGGRSSLPLYPASHTATPRLSGRSHVAQPPGEIWETKRPAWRQPLFSTCIFSGPECASDSGLPARVCRCLCWTFDRAGSPHCSLGGGARAGPLSTRPPGNLEMALPTLPPHPENGACGPGFPSYSQCLLGGVAFVMPCPSLSPSLAPSMLPMPVLTGGRCPTVCGRLGWAWG